MGVHFAFWPSLMSPDLWVDDLKILLRIAGIKIAHRWQQKVRDAAEGNKPPTKVESQNLFTNLAF